MVLSREEAARKAESMIGGRCDPGTCQLTTRLIYGAPSAGDRDGDGDADAVDGWLSEPPRYRHPGDRNPPRGVPLASKGGSRGYGHRWISLGNGRCASTDMRDGHYMPGHYGVATIDQIERSMGQAYLGWSESIDGILIPGGGDAFDQFWTELTDGALGR